jgi:hypothetical protein
LELQNDRYKVVFQVHHRKILCFDGYSCLKSSFAQVGYCGRKQHIQSFPAEVREFLSIAHRFLLLLLLLLLLLQRKIVILGRISMEETLNPFLFITYFFL